MPRPEDDPTAQYSNQIQAQRDNMRAAQATADAKKQEAKQQKKKSDSGDDGGVLGFVKTAAQAAIPGLGGLDLGGGKAPPVVAQTKYAGAVASQAQSGASAVKESPPGQAVQNATAPLWKNTFGDAIASGARWGMTALQAPEQVAQSEIRGAASEVSDISKGDLSSLNPFSGETRQKRVTRDVEQTTLGQAAVKGKDLGSGIMPELNSEAAKAQAEAARKYSPYLIDGHAFTPGRALAQAAGNATGNTIFEPNSTEFRYLSGITDAAVTLGTDPVNLAGGTLAETRAAAKGVKAVDAATEVDQAFTRNPKILTSLTNTRAPEEAKAIVPGLTDATAQRIASATTKDATAGILKGSAVAGETTPVTAGEQVSLIQQAGGTNALTRHIDGQGPLQFMASPAWSGEKLGVRQALIKTEGDMGAMWRVLNKAPEQLPDGEKFYPLLRDAVQTGDPQEVDNVMYRALGVGQKQTPRLGLGYAYRKIAADHPALDLGLVPEYRAPIDNPDKVVDNLDRYMSNGHVPVDRRNQVIHDYLEASSSRGNSIAARHAAGDAVKAQLVQNGVDESRADELVKFSDILDTRDRASLSNQIADSNGLYPPGPINADGPTQMPMHPYEANAIANDYITFGNHRDIARAASEFRPLLENGLVKSGTTLGDAFMSAWRPLHILRPAITARLFLDEQTSMLAHGLSNMITSPLSTISWSMSNPENKLAEFFDKLATRISDARGNGGAVPLSETRGQADMVGTAGLEQLGEQGGGANALTKGIRHFETQYGKGGNTTTGAPWDFHGDDSLSNVSTGFASMSGSDGPKIIAQRSVEVGANNPSAPQGLLQQLIERSNPVMRRALTDTPDGANEWLWSGEGAQLRTDMARDNQWSQLATDRNFSDSYMNHERMYADMLTGGNQDLKQAMVSGTIGGEPLAVGGVPNPAAADVIKGILKSGEGPTSVPVSDLIGASQTKLQELKDGVQGAVSSLFFTPSQQLARNNAFKQYYWQNAADLMPYVAPSEREAVIGAAEQANLDKTIYQWFGDKLPGSLGDRMSAAGGDTLVDKMRATPSVVSDGDTRAMSASHLDMAARGQALDDFGKTIHVLNDRGQLWDSMRLVAPFGDAWSKITSRWAQTIYEHPEILRKVELGVEGARGAGFFRNDPTTGQENFVLPGSEWVTDKLVGAPVPLQAPISGLSLLGEGLPGIGPVAAIPTSTLMKDSPTYDTFKQYVFPYGEPPDTGTPQGNLVDQLGLVPSWAKRIAAVYSDPGKSREYGNEINWIMRYKVSTGEYKTNTAQELDKLYHDSKDEATRLGIVRGIAQAFSPSAPAPQWKVRDKNGKLVDGSKLVQEWITLQGNKKLSSDQAMQQFMDKHGQQNFMLTQAFSEPVRGFAPMTDTSQQWIDQNRKVKDLYPDTYGLFSPPGGKFSLDAWQQQLQYGDRKELSPPEMVKRANDRLASFMYRQERQTRTNPQTKLPRTRQDQSFLSAYKDQLAQQYPGYNPGQFDPSKNPGLIRQLDQASKDPQVQQANPQISTAVRLYLDERDKQLAKTNSGRSFQAQSDERERKALQTYADELAARYRGFGRVFDSVFLQEIR